MPVLEIHQSDVGSLSEAASRPCVAYAHPVVRVACAEACGGAGERDGTCPGLREGWLARSKVLDLFVDLARRYVAHATMRPARRFFVKVDPDTVVLPHNLLAFAGELHDTLGPAQPFLFGMAACRVPSFNLCHAAGGAGYGLSRRALAALDSFVRDGYPPYGDAAAFLARVARFTSGGAHCRLLSRGRTRTATCPATASEGSVGRSRARPSPSTSSRSPPPSAASFRARSTRRTATRAASRARSSTTARRPTRRGAATTLGSSRPPSRGRIPWYLVELSS